eukprot:412172_1
MANAAEFIAGGSVSAIDPKFIQPPPIIANARNVPQILQAIDMAENVWYNVGKKKKDDFQYPPHAKKNFKDLRAAVNRAPHFFVIYRQKRVRFPWVLCLHLHIQQ